MIHSSPNPLRKQDRQSKKMHRESGHNTNPLRKHYRQYAKMYPSRKHDHQAKKTYQDETQIH